MKILIIDNDELIVDQIKESFLENDSVIVVFKTISHNHNCREIYLQLENLCQFEKFDIGLVDYRLSEQIDINCVIETLENFKIPFVSFSFSNYHHMYMKKLGAIHSIDKNELYDGYNKSGEWLVEKLKPLVPYN